ncbi:Glyoxalase-like domain protein [compost metagenome]
MAKQIFVNLPVKDLKKSMNFFTQLGFEFDMNFTNENAACLVLGPNIYSMLLQEEFFKTFTPKQIIDAKKDVEVLIGISAESRQEVDEMAAKAKKAGGTSFREFQDYGFMYSQAFQDLDGHVWEVIWMDETANK